MIEMATGDVLHIELGNSNSNTVNKITIKGNTHGGHPVTMAPIPVFTTFMSLKQL